MVSLSLKIFHSSKLTTKVKSVEMHRESWADAVHGDNVDFNAQDVPVKDILRGFAAVNGKDDTTKEGADFIAQVCCGGKGQFMCDTLCRSSF